MARPAAVLTTMPLPLWVAISPMAVASLASGRGYVWNSDGSGISLVLRVTKRWRWVAFRRRQRIVSCRATALALWNSDGTGEPLVLRVFEACANFARSRDGKRIAAPGRQDCDRVGAPRAASGPTIPSRAAATTLHPARGPGPAARVSEARASSASSAVSTRWR
jgi:hypothetical protein